MEGVERFVQLYKAGEPIFCEGDIGKDMFVVLSGCVKIVRQLSGEGTQLLAELAEGEMFGEMALVAEGRRFATALAGDAGAQVVRIDQARFVYLVSQQPAFALSVIRTMAQRLANAGNQAAHASLEVV